MTLVTRGPNRSGQSIAGISLRELSVRGCVQTDSGAKARLSKGTLCTVKMSTVKTSTVTKIGGAGISADLTATGANIPPSAASATILRPAARHG